MFFDLDHETQNYYGLYIQEGKSTLHNTILNKLKSDLNNLEFNDIKCESNEYKFVINALLLAGFKLLFNNYNTEKGTCNIKFEVVRPIMEVDEEN
jgi:hypothetical protein